MACLVRSLVWGDLALAAVGAVCSALVHSPDTWAQARLFPATGSRGGGGGKGLRHSCLVGSPCRETVPSALAKLQRASGVLTQVWALNSSGTAPRVSLHLWTLWSPQDTPIYAHRGERQASTPPFEASTAPLARQREHCCTPCFGSAQRL